MPIHTPILRPVLVRCSCGWETEVQLDVAQEPPVVQIHRCPAPGCGNVLVVKLAVDVIVKSKTEPVRQWWTPRLAE